MNNFDPHEQAQQLADTRSAYSLARELLELKKAADSTSKGGIIAVIREAFPVFDNVGLDEAEHCCEWTMLHERKRLHRYLQEAPSRARAQIRRELPAYRGCGIPLQYYCRRATYRLGV